jgi:hypothetical protein
MGGEVSLPEIASALVGIDEDSRCAGSGRTLAIAGTSDK